MRILGISAYYHDSAAALIEDGNIIAAAQEERFTRIKGDSSFPHNAIGYCLDVAGIQEQELDHVIFYENPYAKFGRLLTTYHLTAPASLPSFVRSLPSWLSRKLWLASEITDAMGLHKSVRFCDHHMAHAASAFFPSPFEDAAVLTIDGVGEWSTTTFGIGTGNKIQLLKHLRFPNSLGLLYSAFTAYTGFKINDGEYKLMGLAPYGEPKYADLILNKLMRLEENGAVQLNQSYFNYARGLTMTNHRFHALFGGPPREPEGPITQREMDIASSIQVVLNETILRMGKHVYEQTGKKKLSMAGGVALNVVATGHLLKHGPFDQIWIQPAAGDAGGALGCALWWWYQVMNNPRKRNPADSMQGALLGLDIPSGSAVDDDMLSRLGGVWEALPEEQLQDRTVQAIGQQKIVAVARGRAEFGPRALGCRSIIADARNAGMQSHLNLKVKFRESFRPFAPMILSENASEYFDIEQESPYMLFCYPVLPEHRFAVQDTGKFGLDRLKQLRSDIPAVTHVDYSARVQTVDAERNPFMHGILSKFKQATGCPVVVNTSFNVRGEPIVNTVEDAYRCFMATEIDCLVVGNRFLEREKQNKRPLNDLHAVSAQGRNSYLERFAERKHKRSLRENILFGLAVGWTLSLVGAFHFYILWGNRYWLWMCLTGVGALVTTLLIPGVMYYPRTLLKTATNKIVGAFAVLLSSVIYLAAIVPMGCMLQLCRGRHPFYTWEKSLAGAAEGWVDKPAVKTATIGRIANGRLSAVLQPWEIFGYFIRHEETILLPTLLLMLMLGVTGIFIQNATIAPMIYTLF